MTGVDDRVAAEPLEWESSLWRTALAQFDHALDHAEISQTVSERLRYPERSVLVSVPILLDSGETRVFPALSRPALDDPRPDEGRAPLRPPRLARRVRRARDVDDVEVRAAASARTAAPRAASAATRASSRTGELERLTRRYTAELAPVIGPKEDIPAPDMATNEQTMAWMMDTYSMQMGHAVPEIVTGKPISIGGSIFRHEATGAGVVMVVEPRVPAARLERSPSCAASSRGSARSAAWPRSSSPSAARRWSAIGDYSGGVARPERARRPRALAAWTAERPARSRSSRRRRATVTNAELLELAVRRARARGARGPAHGRERAARAGARWSRRARTGRRRSRRTRSSPSAASPILPDVPDERGRRHRFLLRVGAGHRAAASGTATRSARGSPTRWPTPSTASGRSSEQKRADAARRRARRRASARWRPRSRREGCTRDAIVREAMVAEPTTLESTSSARRGGRAAVAAGRPRSPRHGRGRHARRRRHADDARARGRRRGARPAARRGSSRSQSRRGYTIDADLDVDEAFHQLEEHDLERVPVVEDGRLVGVLSRSVLQRRLAEDEGPESPEEPTAA